MIIKRYQNSDRDKVVELLNVCFPEKDISRESFIWKHFDSYFNKKTIAYTAKIKSEIASFVCFVPSTVSRGNTKYNFYSCAIQSTLPQYRQKGIISSLTQEIEKSLGKNANYYGFSNSNGIKIDLNSKRIQYDIIGQMVTTYMPSSPFKTSYTTRAATSISLGFLQKHQNSFLQIRKDANLIDWRYMRHPKQKYKYIEILDEQKIIGYVIAREMRTRYEIYDILAKDDPALFRKIVLTFLHFSFIQDKVLSSMSYLPNRFWKKAVPILHITKKIEIYFTIKSDNVSHDTEKWMIQGGDIS